MDLLDGGLESSGHVKGEEENIDDDQPQLVSEEGGEEQASAIASVVTNQGTLALDPNVQYQFRTETGSGPVTYRVVQVTQGEDGQTQVVAGIPGQQTVLQSPFSNGGGGSPPQEPMADSRFTYVPAASVADAGVVQAELAAPAQAMGQELASDGVQFYVMMSPQDVLQAGQRTIAPRTGISPRVEGGRSTRDERRRATHNEVERRRRDKINNWIVQLSKLVPDCANDHKQGQVLRTESKGGILSKACDYITELRTNNVRMGESLKETERLSVDAELLRQQCEELKQENAMLRAQLQQHGIVPPDLTGATS